MTTALQKSDSGILDTLTNTKWTRSVMDVVRKLRVPKGCTDEEFFVFMQQCIQSGLNPLLGHAYCVPRRTNIAPKGAQAQYVTNHVFQPAIDGMRARAGEFPDFEMVDSGAVYERDQITIDKGTGEVSHKTNPAGARGRLVSAWGRVRKKNGKAVVVELPVGARSGESAFWNSDPGGMLAKCCEAAALRKTYPVVFGGMHIPEEMPDESEPPSRATEVLQRIDAPPTAPTADKPALPPPGPVVVFGEWRDRVVDGLERSELVAAISYGEGQLADPKHAKAKFRPALEKNLDLLRAALAAMPEPSQPPREPGADDGAEDPAYVAVQEAAAMGPGSAG